MTASILRKLLPRNVARWVSRGATAVVIIVIVLLSLSRSIALVVNYGATMTLYRHLPEVDITDTTHIECI